MSILIEAVCPFSCARNLSTSSLVYHAHPILRRLSLQPDLDPLIREVAGAFERLSGPRRLSADIRLPFAVKASVEIKMLDFE